MISGQNSITNVILIISAVVITVIIAFFLKVYYTAFIMAAKKKKAGSRLDREIVKRGLAPDTDRAKAYIMAGDVSVNGQVHHKADTPVTGTCEIQIKEKYPYVSRGASKIQKAFETFAIDPRNLEAMDIGVSTGGFTDYMLQRGARHVTGVDVNIKQTDYKLHQDPRVTLVEKNARHLEASDIAYTPQLITIDVSFISITRILPQLTCFPHAKIISLVKPQFEVHRNEVEKGGLVRDKVIHLKLLTALRDKITGMGYAVTGLCHAGVKGRKGNQEYFFLLEYGKNQSINDKMITHELEI